MRKVYTLVFVLTSFIGFSQQDIQFTQYMFNKLYYNPGFAGSGNNICITGFHRSQWVGFDGAPTSQNINANVALPKISSGVSLKLVNDQIGFFQNFSAGIGYAYQYPIGNGKLGGGISFDFFSTSVNNANWSPPDGILTLVPGATLDGSIPKSDANGMTFDMDFGLYYSSPTFWAGISSTRLLASAISLTNFANQTADYYHQRHYYLMGGYNWQIPASNIELRPSTLIKSDFAASPTVDVNVTGVYNNKFWGGVSYRLSEAAAVNIGYQFTEALKAGYSYDIPISQISQQGGGSHEIFLSYCFNVVIPPKIPGSHRNPRFL